MDTDTAWNIWGTRDPYYGVLTDPKFRTAALTNESREEFFASGRGDSEHVFFMCKRCAGPEFSPARVLDFGCGVGRMAIPFAIAANEVVAVDVAPSMISEARRNCAERGLTNVVFGGSDDSLSGVEGQFDLVHSSIVLQHIATVRGRAIFVALVGRVGTGGCGAIHVTFGLNQYTDTFGSPPPLEHKPSALANIKALARRTFENIGILKPPAAPETVLNDADPDMQMNFYNLSELMFILQQSGVKEVISEFTNHGGALGVYLFFYKS